jgi:hypothetical protein
MNAEARMCENAVSVLASGAVICANEPPEERLLGAGRIVDFNDELLCMGTFA